MWRWVFTSLIGMAMACAGSALGAKASKSTKPKDTLAGTIHKIDYDAQTIAVVPTVAKSAPAGKPVQIPIDEKTSVTVDGAAAKFSDLKEGMAVKITPSTGTAEKIAAKTKAPKDNKEACKFYSAFWV